MNTPIEDAYVAVKRFSALILGLLLLGISIWFSAEGLNFNLKESFFFGIVIALAVTVFEFIFDEDGFTGSITMAVIGVGAYAYGIISNYFGIWIRQGQPVDGVSIAFAVILSIFIEVAPEQLILWSLGLTGKGIRDMLSNFVNKDRMMGHVNGKHNYSNNTNQQHPTGESYSPSQKHSERLKDPQYNRNDQGKKKRKWQPGMVGRPPKDSGVNPNLAKILGQNVTEE